MTKSLLYLFFFAILMSSCASSDKLLQRGQYDQAIEKSVKKLRKKPSKTKKLNVLKEAYAKANAFDRDRISFLELENRTSNSVEILDLYERLNQRQNRVKTLPTALLSQFSFVNYNEVIVDTRREAAETSYQRGVDFLNRGDRLSARNAYLEFDITRSIYPDYKDVSRLIIEARELGTNKILFVVENNSDVVLPSKFEEQMRTMSLADLNRSWTEYQLYENSDVDYDYLVVLNIKTIGISPEQIKTEKYTETKEIQDGTKYILDERGNVKKDSTGTDIREPNMVTISAEITENQQYKEAIVGGSIDYIDVRTDQLIKTENLSITSVFQHFSATSSGDQRALSAESRKKLETNLFLSQIRKECYWTLLNC